MSKSKNQTKNAKKIAEHRSRFPKWSYNHLKDKLFVSVVISFLIAFFYTMALSLNLNVFDGKYLSETNLIFVCIIIVLVVWASIQEWKSKKNSIEKVEDLLFPKFYKSSWIIVIVILSGISFYLATQAKSANFIKVSYSLNLLAFFIFLSWNVYLSVFKAKNDKSISSYLVALKYIIFAYVPTIASFFITIYPNMYGLIDSMYKGCNSAPTNLVVSVCLAACLFFVIGEQFYLRAFNPPTA